MDNFIQQYQVFEYDTLRFSSAEDGNAKLKERPGFTFFHNNIRSISKNFDDLQVVLSQFEFYFDIIALTETWNIYNHDNFKLNGYNTIYNFGEFNQNDGILVFIKDSLNYEFEIINIGIIKCLRISIKAKTRTYFVTVIYRPPSTDIDDFNLEFCNYLNHRCIYQNEIIIGDININIIQDSIHATCYLNNLYQAGFLSCINDYTRVQDNYTSCIDHIFIKTKVNKNEITPIILETTITDHFSIILQVSSCQPSDNKNSKKIITKKVINYNKLREYLANENWNDMLNHTHLNKITDYFVNKLKEYISLCTTATHYKTINTPRKPWITNGLIKSIKTRDELFQKYKRNNDLDSLHKYKIYRNKINSLITKTKASYFRNKISENAADSKFIWKTVNNSLDKNLTSEEVKSIKVNDKIVNSKLQIADEFNSYYINIAEQMANKIKISGSSYDNDVLQHNNNSMFLKPINEVETKKYIVELKCNKSPGFDEITANTLKEVADYIALPLTNIINLSFESSECPDHFKTAIVKPLYKGGDKELIENYRPISLISNLGKIFEKALKYRLVDYLTKSNLLSNRQFGFKQNTSTQDAIAQLTNLIYKNIDNSDPTIAVFIDLAKAFDTISHTKLLEKLNYIGIRGNINKLIKHYLYNRKQYVKIDDTISNPLIIKNGVPQGTVLGPILFIIFINDLLTVKSSGTILSYADDTVILYEAENWSSLRHKISKDLKEIKLWLDKNLLTMNIKKTKFLPFASYKNSLPEYSQIVLHASNCKSDECNCETFIEKAETFKYLGLTLDTNLKWDAHISLLVKKLRGFCYVFKQLREFLSIKILKQVYFALVESHISYGIIGWGGIYKNTLKNLETTQKLIIKIIFRRNINFNSNELYNEANILDIRQLFCKIVLQKLYKSPGIINASLENNIYFTRSKENKIIDYPIVKKTQGKRSYSYLSIKIYNILPKSIKEEKSYTKYLKYIKNWLLILPRSEIHQIFE